MSVTILVTLKPHFVTSTNPIHQRPLVRITKKYIVLQLPACTIKCHRHTGFVAGVGLEPSAKIPEAELLWLNNLAWKSGSVDSYDHRKHSKYYETRAKKRGRR